ncbi:hypothetical protein H310_04070 [Aphanomyces invadans]|uniref:PHD-type domain-containing protein n=1 Tax=Aphanomyces invadans TaxID=157072 RepID=A0A024UGL7_9STRA|nr:hypothetical protein H310_04070 [Aphanomyces invadans]ETW05012.1 hypothetical protein H310_04070 [Aphanomyces invadans]|eukprot:XP_008866450.1 hypothetical protein H310_04070 [Aphanomyces invadans]
MMSVGQMCSQEAEVATSSDVEVPRTKKTSSKRARSRKRHSPAPVSDERESSVQDDDDDDDDESTKSDNGGGGGGSDHNRWYCNICKDGGELLCCDRCPRAFHTACLSMDPDDIPRPDSSWFCKLCSDTLERRNAKRAAKDQKRHQREEEKRLRDLAREAKLRERDEALARRSAKALEDKTKRVLEMKERIVKKQKVTYKDREEEKLGKIAENSAETIRQAKEKLEKLEKEDAILKKKEQALAKSRRQNEQDEITDVGPIPEATPCNFGGIPSTMFRQVLSAWDFVLSFQKVVGISPMSIEQLCGAMMSPKFSPLVNELHMCLLDLILENREGDAGVSEEDADMDPSDRYRFEVVNAPLTVGVPTSNMLNFLSWPAVLANLITAVPRYFNNASPVIKAAVATLDKTEYPQLSITHKLALLEFLITLAYSTDKIGRLINLHVQERTEASKEHNRLLFQEKRDKAEENKRALEQQKADKAKLASEQKVAMQNWLKGGKKGAAPFVDDDSVANSHTDDASSTQSEHDDDDSESSSDEDDEELKGLQAKGIISRQEYLVRKKKLEIERDARRKEKEERARKSKQKEQLLKKRALLVEELNLAMEMRDLDRLQLSLKAAKENGMHTTKKPKVATGVYVAATPADVKLYEDAIEFAERLEADVAKEQEMEERKQSFEKAMREYFIRTQALGKDGASSKYWLFRGDAKRVYVEHSDGKWLYYDSPTSVQGLLEALHDNNPLKKELLPHVDFLVKEMAQSSSATNDEWQNKAKSWGISYHDLTLDEVKKELLRVQETVTARLLTTRGTMWVHIQQAEWIDNVQTATSIPGLVYAVLALEREVSGQDEVLFKVEDDDDEDEDETFAQNSLWPSKQSRDRWISVVTDCFTLSSIALSLAALVQRLDIWSVTGGSSAIKKEAKVKRESKRIDYDDDADGSEASPVKAKRQSAVQTVEREWEEYCCICKDGGDLLCCDGCPKVFHFTCVGLRRIPRGKTFCPSCDRSVKPVYPVVMPQLKGDASYVPIKSEEEWDAFCNVCKNGGELLLCDGCPRAFHVECLKLENFDANEDWFCVDCENQSCGQCKKGRIRMDSHVICGNEAGTKGCERVFHLKCAKLDKVPVDDWYCKRCLKLTK